MTSRRDFLGVVGVGALLPSLERSHSLLTPTTPASADWDMSWVGKIKGEHRAVFDAPELSHGLPLVRACLWAPQCADVYGARPGLTSSVLVLRHKAFAYAMDDATWDRFDLAKANDLTMFAGPVPMGNPVRAARAEMPEPFRNLNLEQFQKDGGVVLGCNMAFMLEMVPNFQKAGNLSSQAAVAEAKSHILPGVILMPSGFFAASAAQDVGCSFIPAS